MGHLSEPPPKQLPRQQSTQGACAPPAVGGGGERGGKRRDRECFPEVLAACLLPALRPRDVTPPATFLCRKRWFASAPLRCRLAVQRRARSQSWRVEGVQAARPAAVVITVVCRLVAARRRGAEGGGEGARREGGGQTRRGEGEQRWRKPRGAAQLGPLPSLPRPPPDPAPPGASEHLQAD